VMAAVAAIGAVSYMSSIRAVKRNPGVPRAPV
jgi:hypothetical protein